MNSEHPQFESEQPVERSPIPVELEYKLAKEQQIEKTRVEEARLRDEVEVQRKSTALLNEFFAVTPSPFERVSQLT